MTRQAHPIFRSLLRPAPLSPRLTASRWTLLFGLIALGGLQGCKSAPEPAVPASTTPKAAPPATPEKMEVPAAAPETPPAPVAVEEPFGEYQGQAVKRYTIANSKGLKLRAMSYGAIITELHVPDAKGQMADVVLGRETLADYVASSPYFGATIGRVANRIKNAAFELGGKKYKLAANDGPNHLHGGVHGWDKVVWNVEAREASDGPQLIFTYVSPDGDEGYPGRVEARTIYTLTNDNELRVEMSATADSSTIVNMAHHSYWNLGGHASGSIRDHELVVYAASYTPAIALVPFGEVKSVGGTPFDFRQAKPIGRDLVAAGGKPIGFDHNWVIDGEPQKLRPVARLKDPTSGRVLELSANQPGLQFYSGNFLDGTLEGKGGVKYAQYSGLCLESQAFPNSVNVPGWRQQVVLEPGSEYRHVMVHSFHAE